MHPHTVTCPMASDLTSQLRWAPALPRVIWLWSSSGAVTCPMAPDLTSRLKWAPALPRVLWLRTSSPGRGGLQRCHASCGSKPHFPTGAGSSVAMCPTSPCGPRVSSIKKSLADLTVQLGTHVPNAHAHVFKTPHIRTIMCLQDVQPVSVVNTCKACKQTSTVLLQCNASTMTTRLAPLQS
jgi:hypothetical protein